MNNKVLTCFLSVLFFFVIHQSFFSESVLPSLQPIVDKLQYQTPCCVSDYFDWCSGRNCLQCPSTLKLHLEPFEYIVPETKIYFHETSGAPSLTWRQACSVESAAYHNPNLNIQLYMVSTSINFTSLPLKALLKYRNIDIKTLDLAKHFDGSPLQGWLYCSQWWSGYFAISHLSDALRYLTLWKFGGYYFDLDVLFHRSVEALRDFVGLESSDWVGAGAMHIRHKHPIIEEVIHEFAAHYKKYEWGYNGPQLFTRVLQKLCKKQLNEIDNCFGFQVLPTKVFYPVSWQNWHRYFDATYATETLQDVTQSTAIHVWNKHSQSTAVDVSSEQPYAQLARKHCPTITKLTSIL